MSVKPPASHRSPTERLVILALGRVPSNDGCTFTELQRITGASETALQVAIRILRREGVVERTVTTTAINGYKLISEVSL